MASVNHSHSFPLRARGACSTLALSAFAALAVACSGTDSGGGSAGAAGTESGGGSVATGGSSAGSPTVAGAGSNVAGATSGGSTGSAGASAGAGGSTETIAGGAGASSGGDGGMSMGGSAAGGSAAGASGAGAPGSAGAGSTFPFKPSYILGADISWTLEDEAGGAKYADANGVKPIEEIMANNGFNFVRLRTFVCPSCPGGYSSQGFCDDKHTVIMAKRVKACGMGLFLDFHMADTWASLGTGASPSAQPSAWKGMTPTQMQQAAHDYTNKVVKELADAGATPDLVQIGNETNAGMSGIPISNWTDLSALIAAAIQGVKEVNPNIGIWVQNGRPRPDSAGGNNFDGWVDTYLGNKGTKLDIDGVCGSTYGTTNSGADWTQSFFYVIDTYKKPVFSCEYTVASPDNNAGQIINTKVMRGFANHMGLGSFIWEPTRYPAVNSNTLFTKSGNTFTTNAAMTAYPTLAKSYGLPVPSAKCEGSQYVY
jgi:arabinogalactan endo-1,4-beta-galactosidase